MRCAASDCERSGVRWIAALRHNGDVFYRRLLCDEHADRATKVMMARFPDGRAAYTDESVDAQT